MVYIWAIKTQVDADNTDDRKTTFNTVRSGMDKAR